MKQEELENAKREAETHLYLKQQEEQKLAAAIQEIRTVQHQLLGRLRFIQEALGEVEPMKSPEFEETSTE